jgi:hypothetical protein
VEDQKVYGLFRGVPITGANIRIHARLKFGLYDDQEFLGMKECPDLFYGLDLHWKESEAVHGKMWQHEFNRRFLLRPLGPQPNTQDGTTLLRAI